MTIFKGRHLDFILKFSGRLWFYVYTFAITSVTSYFWYWKYCLLENISFGLWKIMSHLPWKNTKVPAPHLVPPLPMFSSGRWSKSSVSLASLSLSYIRVHFKVDPSPRRLDYSCRVVSNGSIIDTAKLWSEHPGISHNFLLFVSIIFAFWQLLCVL